MGFKELKVRSFLSRDDLKLLTAEDQQPNAEEQQLTA